MDITGLVQRLNVFRVNDLQGYCFWVGSSNLAELIVIMVSDDETDAARTVKTGMMGAVATALACRLPISVRYSGEEGMEVLLLSS